MHPVESNCRAPRLFAALACLTAVATLAPLPTDAQSAPPVAVPGSEVTVHGNFLGKKGKTPATDLSGIACLPPGPGGTRECLAINDENRGAQRARLAGDTLAPGAEVPILGREEPADALGVRPSLACPGGPDDFEDLDGEGVALAPGATPEAGTFYVVGSHGCSRGKAKGRLSSFLLARIPFFNGAPGRVEFSWRLSDALAGSPALAPFFAQPLDKDHQGLNVEGIAAVGGDLLFGLRAPAETPNKPDKPVQTAFLARVPAAALFAPGHDRGPAAEVVPLALGEGVGVRDLAALPDGKLLVLTGPAQDQEVPYAVRLAELSSAGGEPTTPRRLADLPDVDAGGERAKAEAILPLGEVAGNLRVLVLFDGLANGGPRTYLLSR